MPIFREAGVAAAFDPHTYISDDGTDTSRTFENKLAEFKSVKDFGATGDGTTDDATDIQAAIDYFTSAGTLFFPDGTYIISTTITVANAYVNLKFAPGATLKYTGTATKAALVIGSSSVDTRHRTFDGLSVITAVSHDHTDETFIGIRFSRVNRSYIRINRAEGFTINVQLWGDSTEGIAYNTFVIGDLLNGKVHLDINSRVASGFINENLFLGGRYGNASSLASTKASYGVRFRAESGAYTSNNNNVFTKPCFEMMDGNSGVERIPIYIDNAGVYNTFNDIRAESGRGPILYAAGANGAYGNKVTVGYHGGSYLTLATTESGAAAYGNEVTASTMFLPNTRLTWNSGELKAKAFGTSTSNITVKGCFMASSSGGAASYSGGGQIFNDCISLTVSQGIGVYVDTTNHRQLIIQTNTLRSRTGRIGVVCYNSSGTLLDSSGANHPYAVGSSIAGASAFGYIYRIGSDGTNRAAIRLHADVAYVKVIISGGSNPVDLRSFSITAVGNAVQQQGLHVYTGLSEAPDTFYVSADPDTARNGGVCTVGMPVFNTAAASAQPLCWVCTTAGLNARLWAVSTAYVIGQVVTNGSNTYVCVTAGTSAGAGGPTGTTAGITDGTVTWDYVGTAAAFTAGPSIP